MTCRERNFLKVSHDENQKHQNAPKLAAFFSAGCQADGLIVVMVFAGCWSLGMQQLPTVTLLEECFSITARRM